METIKTVFMIIGIAMTTYYTIKVIITPWNKRYKL
jgi:hypothetical protein